MVPTALETATPTILPTATLTPTPTVTPTATPVPLVTYTSQLFGYSFDYPENWTLQDLGQVQVVTAPLGAAGAIVTVDVLPGEIALDEYTASALSLGAGEFEITAEPEPSATVRDALETGYGFVVPGEPAPWTGTLLTAVSGRLGFTLAVQARSSALRFHAETLEAILGSLRVPNAEPEALTEVYLNNAYGYSIRYPKGWTLVDEIDTVSFQHPLGTNLSVIPFPPESGTAEELLALMAAAIPGFEETDRVEIDSLVS